MFSSAIVISTFSAEVLEVEDKPDTGPEARNCQVASSLLLFALNRLFNAIKSDNLSTFRRTFIGYRFSVRHFLACLETWKKLDAERAASSFEIAYMESYGMFLTAKKMHELLVARKAAGDDGSGMF